MGNIPDWPNGWKMDGPTLMLNMYLKAKLRTFMKLVTTAFSRLAPRSTLSRDGENERQSGGISTSQFKTFFHEFKFLLSCFLIFIGVCAETFFR